MKRKEKKELIAKAALRAAWREWIEAEVKEGRNRDAAEEMAIIYQFCRIFELTPQQFGVQVWPGGKPIGCTYKTGYIMASLVLALITERVDNPPLKFIDIKELVKALPVIELYKQKIPAI